MSLETKEHLKAKELLFDWIITKQVKIFDNLGNQYDLMNGKNKNEFLHGESLVIDNKNSVIYSSTHGNLPCKRLLSEDREFIPLCDMKGHTGAVFNLPCHKCLKTVNGRFHEIKFVPDLSYGYKNSHKIWFEIFKTSGSSFKKMKHCSKNKITLLEIDVEEILRLEKIDGEKKIVFNNLNNYYEQIDLKSDSWEEIITNYVNQHIDRYGYIEQRILISQIDGLSVMKSQIKHRTRKIIQKLNLKSTKGRTTYFEDLLGIYPKSNRVLLMKSEDYNRLYDIVEEEHKTTRKLEGRLNQVELFLEFIRNSPKGEYTKKEVSNKLSITKLNRVLNDPIIKNELNVSFSMSTRTINIF
ncbi:hypothetical protein WKH57_01035 [Niallia taxi]|uniref:hypothetical protein n=1 Tax=Niallia taxi TaxID=2499688 RepID=UPI0031823871